MEQHLLPPSSEQKFTTTASRSRSFGSTPSTTSIHVTALDGLVNVNSLFTIAVFVGLSFGTSDQKSLEGPDCDASTAVLRDLLLYKIISFSCFLFSSLVAQGLKLSIILINSKDVDEVFKAYINSNVLKLGMLGSAAGSVMGCVFLMLSMVNVVQVRLGTLSCGAVSTLEAVCTLIVLVAIGLVVYISNAIHAFML